MKIVKLPTTGLEFEAPDNFYYHDDDLVNSLIAHSSKLSRQYNVHYLDPLHMRIIEAVGLEHLYRTIAKKHHIPLKWGVHYVCCKGYNTAENALKAGAEVHIHTYVLNGFGELETVLLKSHEETHTLITLKKLDVLKRALKEKKIKIESLGELPDEAICNVGGLYGLLHNFPDLNSFSLDSNVSIGHWKYIEITGKWIEENSSIRFGIGPKN